MSQIFHRSANTISRVSIFGAVFAVAGLLGLLAQINRSPWVTEARVAREQPIQFSHERHVAGNGIDCRYCHTSVENSRVRRHPADEDLHELPFADLLEQPVPRTGPRQLRNNRPIAWTRVHDLPDFVYFNHSIHVNKGVGCTTCHGQVDRMPLMWQEQSLQMEWCLDCHRNPEAYVRPREAVFRVDYQPPANQAELGAAPGRGISDSETDELFDVPPMNDDQAPGSDLPDSGSGLQASGKHSPRARCGERSTSSPTIRRSASGCTTNSRPKSKRSPIRRRAGRS